MDDLDDGSPADVPELESSLDGVLLKAVVGDAGAKAISRLIGAATDLPVAALNWLTNRIKNDDVARTRISVSLADAAASLAATDRSRIDRAMSHWLGREVREQANRESVAENAIQALRVDGASPASEGPTEDFMNIFESIASRASSDELRKLLGGILAGEIRKPYSYSLRTLQIVALVDKRLAEDIQITLRSVATFSMDNVPLIILHRDLKQNDGLMRLSALADLGVLIGSEMNMSFHLEQPGDVWLAYRKKIIVIKGSSPMRGQFSARRLSVAGQEMATLMDTAELESEVFSAAHALKSTNPDLEVIVADIMDKPNQSFIYGNPVVIQ